EGADRLARDGGNVVARGVKLAYEAAGRAFTGCELACVNRIPTSRGLGSSAAAWVGGLVAGNVLLGSPLSRDALLGLAARAEGHPDNVAAAIFGGLTVSCGTPEGVTAVTLPVAGTLSWVVLVPEVTSATAEARALLPRSVPRGRASHGGCAEPGRGPRQRAHARRRRRGRDQQGLLGRQPILVPRRAAIVLVVWVALAVGNGLYFSFSVFLVPLVDEFHWSRGLTAGAQSISTIVQGLPAPVAGILVDRFGPRRVILTGAAL